MINKVVLLSYPGMNHESSVSYPYANPYNDQYSNFNFKANTIQPNQNLGTAKRPLECKEIESLFLANSGTPNQFNKPPETDIQSKESSPLTEEDVIELYRKRPPTQKQTSPTDKPKPSSIAPENKSTQTESVQNSINMNIRRMQDPYLREVNLAIYGDFGKTISKNNMKEFCRAAEEYALYGTIVTDYSTNNSDTEKITNLNSTQATMLKAKSDYFDAFLNENFLKNPFKVDVQKQTPTDEQILKQFTAGNYQQQFNSSKTMNKPIQDRSSPALINPNTNQATKINFNQIKNRSVNNCGICLTNNTLTTNVVSTTMTAGISSAGQQMNSTSCMNNHGSNTGGASVMLKPNPYSHPGALYGLKPVLQVPAPYPHHAYQQHMFHSGLPYLPIQQNSYSPQPAQQHESGIYVHSTPPYYNTSYNGMLINRTIIQQHHYQHYNMCGTAGTNETMIYEQMMQQKYAAAAASAALSPTSIQQNKPTLTSCNTAANVNGPITGFTTMNTFDLSKTINLTKITQSTTTKATVEMTTEQQEEDPDNEKDEISTEKTTVLFSQEIPNANSNHLKE